jgi:D-alanyl-D-alanine carboxypeptidase/D-alanyl-D-alanine-endopeptidase (penicillin-binding protein 4)
MLPLTLKNTLKSIGVDLSNMKIADGSGLAVTNRLSPRFLGSLLTKMAQSDDAKNYVSLFPAVGKEGSVRSLLADTRLAGKLVMKSGSMSGVLCYAGYKLDDSGQPTHVVIIMVNGFTCRVTEVRSAVNKWLLTQF